MDINFRILWILIITNFMALSFYYSIVSWNEAVEKQTVTVSDAPNYPISKYYFPAITVCNFNVISKKRALAFLGKLKKLHNSTFQHLTDKLYLMKHLTDIPCPLSVYNDLTEISRVLENNNIEAADLFQNLSLSCKEMIQRCTWKGQQTPCDVLFKTVATPYGFCCSFNYFGFKEEFVNSTERAYLTSPKAPRRVSATGYLTGLETIINSVSSDYFTTLIPSIGHKIIVHFPYDFPDKHSQMLLQFIEELHLISLHPTSYRTDSNVNSLNIDKRNCAFVGEKDLDYFIYTFHNCLSECRADSVKYLCGCVPFYYLQFSEHTMFKSVRVCNLRDTICVSQNIDLIYKMYSNCTCTPNCNYIRYAIESSSSIFTKQFVEHKPALYGGVKLNNQSVIRIFFDDLVSTSYTTSLRYYWHTILGRIGGVLGLLMGFSATSIIEVTYFFIIRPIVDVLYQYRIIYLYAKGGYQ